MRIARVSFCRRTSGGVTQSPGRRWQQLHLDYLFKGALSALVGTMTRPEANGRAMFKSTMSWSFRSRASADRHHYTSSRPLDVHLIPQLMQFVAFASI